MSRIGKKPVPVPKGVTVSVEGLTVKVKGPRGELSRVVHRDMKVSLEGTTVIVARPSDEPNHKALHGLTRTLIANMVEGVTAGFKKQLEIVGVGYKAEGRPFGGAGPTTYGRWSIAPRAPSASAANQFKATEKPSAKPTSTA